MTVPKARQLVECGCGVIFESPPRTKYCSEQCAVAATKKIQRDWKRAKVAEGDAEFLKKRRASHRRATDKRNKRYREDPEYRAKLQQWARNKIAKLRLETLSHYSNGTLRCSCCGETSVEFLSVSHSNNDGATHRKATGTRGGWLFYRALKKAGFPDDLGLEVLCANCNSATAVYGYCPHKSRGKNGSTTT
jgi:hypothetical protein